MAITWDAESRLTQASTRKQSVRYKFDALGRRVQRVAGKENTKFIYDGQDVLVDDNDGSLTKYQNGLGIADKVRMQTGSDVSYFLADHLGSTNGLTDSTGALTVSTAYDSFGNATNPSFPDRYQFTGREFDNFTKLQYSRARIYDSNIGRFLSEDPIGFGGGAVNLYGYVGNNPLNFSDPTGKVAVPAIGYAVFEFCATGYDVYDFYSTLSDPGSDWTDVGLSGGGLLIGSIAPGSAYGTGLKGVRKSIGGLLDDVPVKIHGNSLDSPRPTWGYKLYDDDGNFLKNGITSKPVPETRYTQGYMSDKYMEYAPDPFPNRREAATWERNENLVNPGPLNFERYIKRNNDCGCK